MPVAAEHNSRTGLTRINALAKSLCRVVRISAPVLRAKYSANAALMTALTTAELLCDQLIPATDAIILDEMGGLNVNPVTAPNLIPGSRDA